jgi:glycosyltransferase involved in cell wall biosynthesis
MDFLEEPRKLSRERLKEIAWEVGTRYPIPATYDYIALFMVHPRRGHVHWHIRKESVEAMTSEQDEPIQSASLIVRVYDVTDIIFDGFNAHMFFDLEISGLSGNYYFGLNQPARNYVAEIGFRRKDGHFHCLAQSNTVFFDRDRPSGNYRTDGLFVGSLLTRVFPVENIFDAPIYERINRELAGVEHKEALSIAVVFIGINPETSIDSPLGSFIKEFSEKLGSFGVNAHLFISPVGEANNRVHKSLIRRVQTFSKIICGQIIAAHEKKPFHVIHCHDWYSSEVGMTARKKLNLPMVLSVHSTEQERTQGYTLNRLSSSICRREKSGIEGADLVIVPHSSTRQQVINLYGASPEKVVVIPDVLAKEPLCDSTDPFQVKRLFGLNQDAPMVLFAGEISHAAGADLLVDALPTVCRNHRTAQFVFAGSGPLKGELETRAWHSGAGQRCRFLGDVSRETFKALLMASDFVVIPARTWQDENLAQAAISCGRPVLTTRQAGVNCVVHGVNGLITFDNPGSIVWGIQELLFNPLKGSMLSVVAKKKANEIPSLESIVAQHYMYYELILKGIRGIKDA